MEGKKTIPVLVASSKPLLLQVFLAVLYLGISVLVTILWYQLLMSNVFPGLVSSKLLPPTLTFDQGTVLVLGLYGITKAVSLVGKI